MRYFTGLFICLLILSGCSSSHMKVENNLIIHEEVYSVPTLNETWMRILPKYESVAFFTRCPGEQVIYIRHLILFDRKWNPDKMKTKDYAAIYDPSYSTPGRQPLVDYEFKGLLKEPIILENNKGFELLYETISNESFCGGEIKATKVRILDVFLVDKKFHFYCGPCARFVLLRYISEEDSFDRGLPEFREMVEKLEWM